MKEAMAAAAPEERRWRREPEGEAAAADWAWSWGAGTDGQLGNGGFDDHSRCFSPLDAAAVSLSSLVAAPTLLPSQVSLVTYFELPP